MPPSSGATPRERALPWAVGVATVAAFVFAGINAAYAVDAAWVDAAGGVVLLALWAARRRLSHEVLSLILCLVCTAIVAGATWSSGPFLANYLWFFPIPPFGAALAGRRLGITLFGVSAALIVGTELAHYAGWRTDLAPPPAWFQLAILLGMLTVTLLFALAYDRARDQAEKELTEARSRAEAADRAKSRFLACMTHELRTPMHGILGMADELSMRGLPPDQRELLETIRSSGQAMLRIIDDLLDHSRIEAGRLELESAPFDPRRLADELVALLRPRARAKGLTLTATVAPDVPAALAGDAFRLRQIVLNLLGNALKFTERGEVRLALSRAPSGALRVAVSDTGVGIDPASVPRLFESFTQADASTSRRFGGTGLGLAITRGLVQAMGGRIDVDSAVGRGSTFTVEVALPEAPALEPPAARTTAPVEPPSRAAERRGRVVLIADDDAVNRRIAALFLERAGYAVRLASDGGEAVALAARETLHAVVLDGHMPVLDGPAAASAIRALPGARARIPIIGLTAAADQDGPACLSAGMNTVVAKPATMAELVEAVDRWTLASDLGLTPPPSPVLRVRPMPSSP